MWRSGLKKRRIVVSPVPKEDLGLLLRLPQDPLVIHARIDEPFPVDVGLVLLAFLDRRLVPIEILVGREPLYGLGG